MTNSIIASPEIFGALVSSLDASDAKKFADNPNAYLKDLGVDAGVSVSAVANTDKEVNIALPFYSSIAKTADSLSDSTMSGVAGGASESFHEAVSNSVRRTANFMRDVAESIETTFANTEHEETEDTYSLTFNKK